MAVIAFFIGLGLRRVIRLRRAQIPPQAAQSTAPALVVFAVGVLMLTLPWRVLYQNRFERIDLAGSRCYQIARDADRLLLYCPEKEVPRNTIVAASDARVHATGIIESIFTAP